MIPSSARSLGIAHETSQLLATFNSHGMQKGVGPLQRCTILIAKRSTGKSTFKRTSFPKFYSAGRFGPARIPEKDFRRVYRGSIPAAQSDKPHILRERPPVCQRPSGPRPRESLSGIIGRRQQHKDSPKRRKGALKAPMHRVGQRSRGARISGHGEAPGLEEWHDRGDRVPSEG